MNSNAWGCPALRPAETLEVNIKCRSVGIEFSLAQAREGYKCPGCPKYSCTNTAYSECRCEMSVTRDTIILSPFRFCKLLLALNNTDHNKHTTTRILSDFVCPIVAKVHLQ
jgi:hypothetical protein